MTNYVLCVNTHTLAYSYNNRANLVNAGQKVIRGSERRYVFVCLLVYTGPQNPLFFSEKLVIVVKIFRCNEFCVVETLYFVR